MSDAKKIVDLQKLVQHPTSLKLLILHTPFSLQISSLWRCTNLIKLDLSKNNLQRFPHIGNLVNLKFMFLHQNKLDSKILKNIFFSDDEPMYSPLAKSIVWVTFWGNKNPFYARHFLVTQTSVLAVDNHMVVPEQRKQSVIQSQIFPFSQQTEIGYILQNKASLTKNATQQEYMEQFWQEMRQLRKKIQVICPVIRIQKVFRGWIVRKRITSKKDIAIYSLQLKTKAFESWRQQVLRNNKLHKYLQKRNKQHFLLPIKQMKLQNIKHKMLQWALRARKRVLLRRMSLSKQMKFYKIFRSNMLMMRSIYQHLEIQNSAFLLINIQNLKYVEATISKFITLFNGDEGYRVKNNLQYLVRDIREGNIKQQFAKFMSINTRSYVIKLGRQKKSKTYPLRSLLNQNICALSNHLTQLKPLFKNQNKINFSSKQKQKMKHICNQLAKKQKQILGEFLVIQGSTRVLKDFIRCVFYLNTKALKVNDKQYLDSGRRINIFSQKSINKLSAVTLIQKFWRGFIFRKKQKQNAQICARQYRAVVKIQRWIRNLPQRNKYYFRNQIIRILKSFSEPYFYVNMNDYLKVVENVQDSTGGNFQKMKFIEQNLVPYFHLVTKKITLFWNPDEQKSNKYNQNVKKCYEIKKIPFDKFFIKSIFKDLNYNDVFYDPLSEKQPSNQDNQKGQFSHLFHFNTLTSIAQKQNIFWIKISCNTVQQTKLRILGILLKSYSFKNGFSIRIYGEQKIDFKKYFKKNILNKQSIFITKGDVVIKQNAQNIRKYSFKSKIYLKQDNIQKPTKMQENLLIFVHNTNENQQLSNSISNIEVKDVKNSVISVQIQNPKKNKKTKLFIQQMYFSQSSIIQKSEASQNHLKKLPNKKQQFVRSNTQTNELIPQSLKRIFPLKKQIKSYKIEKRIKQRQPSFVLDNVSKNQRIATQPDLSIQKDDFGQKSQHSLLQYSSVKQKLKKQYLYRKNLTKSNKQEVSFHQNFVNLNNFLQQQSISQQRRRIKTQLQISAYESADKIRISFQKSSEDLNKRKLIKMKKVEQDIKIHKQTLQKHRLIKQQQKQEFQRAKSVQRQKRQQTKHQVRRLKVSFAEECFPIVNRSYNMKPRSQSVNKMDSKGQNQKKYIISSGHK